MGSCEWVIMGLESQALSAWATKHFVTVFSEYGISLFNDSYYTPIFLAFSLGRGVVAGASALGIGALCFYGLGLSNEPGAMERSL